ncbi:methyl-accepting chemotaxis protein [Devosia sp.]|uniref:methyl-accepting chemotaxis protein n=1 Tax=Devosia sp. TaxID=1871048 RepID=UPI001AC21A65|nr:methyl-accepting chemotaxis protein [Devosia sp.]MBN9332049.1 cache domain-containing protein [Devosia sp.]
MARSISALFGRLSLRFIIATLVTAAIVVSITVVAIGIYLNFSSTMMQQGRDRQEANLRTAATIFAAATNKAGGTVVNWGEDGALGKVTLWALLPFFDTELVDGISRVTGGETSIYIADKDTKDLVINTTTLKDASDTSLKGQVLDPAGVIIATLKEGRSWLGEETIGDKAYYAAYHPVVREDGAVAGAIFVGETLEAIEGSVQSMMVLMLVIAVVTTLVLGVIGYILSLIITRPLPRIGAAMDAIARGEFETDVPYLTRGNEVGAMARAVEVFRENGLRVAQMTEAEAARIIRDQEERQIMMVELQRAFGDVVEAAIEGDFSRRVPATFPDAELNGLANSVNTLVGSVDRGLEETGTVLSALANTDLTRRMQGEHRGAFAKLKSDINAVAEKLTDIVIQFRSASGTLKTATGEILSGANDLSERTTRQAATIEETSAAMEQLASTVLGNAARAKDASANAAEVTRTAEDGGVAMQNATGAMERITQSSAKISNIIGMIDDIAFQTNLLALNASVEAARAGDAGKGFAVVAVEVRRLAQSAAQASSEVKVLIEQSAGEVASGSKLVEEAASKLASVLDAIRDNTASLEAIARDSRDQAGAIEEITTAVRQMDQMTQHNAALVEETNAAIEQTEAQANELDRIVDIFRLDGRSGQRSAVVERRPAAAAAAKSGGLRSVGSAAISADWDEF